MNDMDPKQQDLHPVFYVLGVAIYAFLRGCAFAASIGAIKEPPEKYKNHWDAPPWS